MLNHWIFDLDVWSYLAISSSLHSETTNRFCHWLQNGQISPKFYDFLRILCSISTLKCLSNFSPKLLKLFLGLYRTIENFGNFLKIIH